MTSKYSLYRLTSPFRSKAQLDLRESRQGQTLDTFAGEFEEGPMRSAVTAFLWDFLREIALVPDFKPGASDSLSKLHGLHVDDIRDDILDPITTRCGIDVSGMSFKGYDLSKIDTSLDVYRFVMEVASRRETSGSSAA